jgi:hypothetical protein
MSIGTVTDSADDTIRMIKAKRWSNWSIPVLALAIAALLDWKTALFFGAIAWTIRIEAERVRAAQWPQCYHAMRLVMDEHGFEFDGEPQIYRTHTAATDRPR